MIGIYKISNSNNNIYIGQSWNIEKRFEQYKRLICKSQVKLFNSLNKYGVENHKFEIIEICGEDVIQHQLDSKEIFWINHYKANNVELLNIRDGGSRGKQSEETKLKLRTKALGRVIGDEQRKKISKNNSRFYLGKNLSEDHKTKIGFGNLGKKRSADVCQNFSKLKLGKKQKDHVVQHRAKMNCKSIIQLTLEGSEIKIWNSIKEASKTLQIKSNSISQVCTKKYKTAGGFKWKYNLNKS